MNNSLVSVHIKLEKTVLCHTDVTCCRRVKTAVIINQLSIQEFGSFHQIKFMLL